jgi:hypothetical protein
MIGIGSDNAVSMVSYLFFKSGNNTELESGKMSDSLIRFFSEFEDEDLDELESQDVINTKEIRMNSMELNRMR